MSHKRFSFDGVVFWGFLAIMAGWAVWGTVLYFPNAWPWVVFPVTATITILTGWWKTHELPWNLRIRAEIPRLVKIRMTLRYLGTYPWHRLRCHGSKATPLARFAALHYHPRGPRSRWYYGIPVGQLAALVFDVNPTIRRRVGESLTAAGITGATLKLAEELPAETAADLARMLSMRAGQLRQSGNLALAWRLWLAYGDEELWEQLKSHNEAAPEEPLRTIGKVALGRFPLAELRDSAVDPAVPRRARAKAAEHLKTVWNLPEDPLEAAPFFVLAGLTDEYRRLDPDGSLLSVAYAGMSPPDRARLRTALSDLGELDLVRQLRDATATHATVTGEDASPARRFRALLAAPLPEAVEAARRLGDWLPDDSQDVWVLNRLHAMDDATLRVARERLTGARQRVLDLPRGIDIVGPASFSPDGARVAVAVRVRNRGWRFREYATGDGRVLGEPAAHPGGGVVSLVHTGSGFAAMNRPHAGSLRRQGLTFTEGDATRVIDVSLFDGVAPTRLWRRKKGFMRHDGRDVIGYDATANLIPATELGVRETTSPRPTAGAGNVMGLLGGRFTGLSADPLLGRIAVLTDRRLRVHDPVSGWTLLVETELVDDDAVLFLDTQTIATIRDLPNQRFAVTRWNVGTSSITKAASAEHANGPGVGNLAGRCRLHRVADGSRMLIAAAVGRTGSDGNEAMFSIDMSTLKRVHTPPQFDWSVLAASPDTRTFIGKTETDAVSRLSLRSLAPHPLATVIDTPMAELSPSDLKTVERQLVFSPAEEKPLVELLYYCLSRRFGDDIALGDGAPHHVTDYDIHLGETR